MLGRLRQRLTYGNVTATLALFIALGGTSYALALPRNSVGSRELKSMSVGTAELKTGAVRSQDIKDRTIRVRDISRSARTSLRGATGPVGPPGPPGPRAITYFAAINSGGQVRAGAAHVDTTAINEQRVKFDASIDSCVESATLATLPGGGSEIPPPGSTITVAPSNDGGVLVRTWDQNNQPKALPFHLIVAC